MIKPCQHYAYKVLEVTKHLPHLSIYIFDMLDDQSFQNTLRPALVVCMDRKPTLTQRNSEVHQQSQHRICTTVISIRLLRHALFMEISLLPFMIPSRCRLTSAAWLRVDFRPKSRAVLFICCKCASALTDWLHMIGEPVASEILAQFNLELK